MKGDDVWSEGPTKMGVSGMVSSDEAVDLGQKDTLTLQDKARALQAWKVGRELWVYVIKLCLLQILNFSEIVSHCLTSPWGVPCWLLLSVSGSLVLVQQTEMNVFSSSEWLALRPWACTLTSLDRILGFEKCVHSLPLIYVSVTNPSNSRFPVSVLPACSLAHM